MTPSDAEITSLMASTASWVSILATTMGPSGPTASRTRSTSAADRTNDTATASTPARHTTSSRRRSSAVGVAGAGRPAGKLTPGRPRTSPPDTTLATTRPPPTVTTESWIPPSPSATRSPAWTWSSRSGSSTAMRQATLMLWPSTAGTSSIVSPSARWAPSSGKLAARTLGPGRSTSTPTVRPTSSAACRTRPIRSTVSATGPWARDRRAMSIPAPIIARRVTMSSDAGPTVATILVRRSTAARLRPVPTHQRRPVRSPPDWTVFGR